MGSASPRDLCAGAWSKIGHFLALVVPNYNGIARASNETEPQHARLALFNRSNFLCQPVFVRARALPIIVKSNFLHPLILAALGAAFSLSIGASGARAQGKTPEFDTKSILALSSSTTLRALSSRGLRVTKQYKNVGWSKVDLATGADVTKTIAALRAQGLDVEPNYIRHLLKTPNDPQYKAQWDMEKIGAPAAWNITTGGKELVGGSDVVVAIVDTGITVSHPDLKANIYVNPREIPNNGKDDDGDGYVDDVNGYDFGQDNGAPDDQAEHGTHVAGTIGAVGNNGVGVTGVNWHVKLLSCRIGSDDGSLLGSSIVSAMDYLVGLKKAGVNIRVANHSYGGYGYSQAEYAAFKRASDVGILNVCAAGNDGYDNNVAPLYPASFDLPGVISVAASDQDDQLASFSNMGSRRVALAAPGVDILSTFPPGINQDGSLYGVLSGTSMASPHVAGALALLLSQTPTLSMQQAQARLFATVDKLPQFKGKLATGGRLNLAKLLAGNIYAVEGRVLRADGTPVQNAVVTIKGDTAQNTTTTTTDATGYYRFSSLVVGRYTLSAQLSGFTFTAASGSTLSFSFAGSTYSQTQNLLAKPIATTYSVFGTAYNFLGNVQEGVGIYVNGSPQPVAVSDAKGKYTIDDLVAGQYNLTAQYRTVNVFPLNSQQSVKDVQLPAISGANTPNVRVDWQVPSIDNTAPTLKLTSPLDGQSYPLGQLKAVAGNAYDNDLLTTLEFTLYQVSDDSGEFIYLPYNWTTGTFGAESDPATPKIITVKNKASAAFNIALSDLPVGTYSLYATARDRSFNAGSQYITFTVTSVSLPNPSPSEAGYPRFTFEYPYADSVVRASSPFTANGSAHADNGVQSLNFYLQRVDERGRSTGYYDWVSKQWVSAQDGSTTLTQNFNGGTDVKWSLPIPALPTSHYVLYGFGIALDGSQPPSDGSLDDNVPFSAGSKPSPLPTATPQSSAAGSSSTAGS